MSTTATRPPPRPSSLPELCAADEAVASALEAVLSANTRLDIHLPPLGQGRWFGMIGQEVQISVTRGVNEFLAVARQGTNS